MPLLTQQEVGQRKVDPNPSLYLLMRAGNCQWTIIELDQLENLRALFCPILATSAMNCKKALDEEFYFPFFSNPSHRGLTRAMGQTASGAALIQNLPDLTALIH